MSETYPEVQVSDNIDAVLNDGEIEGVVIAAPAVMHYEIAKRALLAGKHVFVEKPLSLTYGDGEKLVQLAAARDKVLFVGHVLHYHPAVIRLKEMINSGVIGRVQYIYSRRLSLGKIRREENILWSFAPHDISIILSLTGEMPSYIDCIGNNFLNATNPRRNDDKSEIPIRDRGTHFCELAESFQGTETGHRWRSWDDRI